MTLFSLLGLFDIAAALLFMSGTQATGTVLTFVFGGLLLVKGITLLTRLPVAFGPLGFVGGLIDLITGIIMYFGSYVPALEHAALVLSAFLILKGLVVAVFGLATGGTPY